MAPRKLVPLVALLGGTIALTGWGAASLGVIGSSGIENSASGDRDATRGAAPLSGDAGGAVDAPVTPPLSLPESTVVVGKSALANPPQPETRTQIASLSMLEEDKEYLKTVARPIETPNECLATEVCIDEYLWSLYERAPKLDTNKVTEKIKTTVKVKGKTQTVIKTVIKYVAGDFTWKDPVAARRAGMSLKDYVIGGVDRGFKLKLYHALRAMDDAGFMPGITSAFRDNYRQSIASGNTAASDSSYHGGSRRGGYGHALAVDLVSVKGETRAERYASSEKLWRWIDAHEQELGIGRPYLDRDPPHVAPIDGKEYADKRGRAKKEQLARRTLPSSDPK
jgi:hypothetical protein